MPYLDEEMLRVNIRTVDDIFLPLEKRFLTFREVQNKFNYQGSILSYYALLNRIPQEWKTLLFIPPTGEIFPWGVQRVQDIIHISKFIHEDFIERQAPNMDIVRELWNRELNLNIEAEEWSKLFIFYD